MLPPPGFALALLMCSIILAGCGSTEESQDTSLPTTPQTRLPPAPENDFETRVDTVRALGQSGSRGTGGKLREPGIRFTVQIGAFKDPRKASRVQELARERYRIPVVNDYHTIYGLYQIRIGFFETRDAAHEFRRRMMAEHRSDYTDSWVVQLKR